MESHGVHAAVGRFSIEPARRAGMAVRLVTYAKQFSGR